MIRFILLIILLLLLDWYVFQALRFTLQDSSLLIRRLFFVVHWSMPFLVAISLVMALQGRSAAGTYLRAFLFIVYFSKIVLAIFLMLDDSRRALLWIGQRVKATEMEHSPSRARFLVNAGWLVAAVPFSTLIYGMLRNAYRYKVYRSEVPISGLPDTFEGLKIVQISDIHAGSFMQKEPVRRAIELINAEKPDLVFFTGDLVNSQAKELDDFMDVFDKIEAKHGIYSVLGNHDYGDYHRWESPAAKKANLEDLKDRQAQLGWKLLLDEHAILEKEGTKLAIIGIQNSSGNSRFKTYGDIDRAFSGAQNAPLKILLSHDPSFWDHRIRPDFPDIQLTLSGHTHGGQFGIEIPGFLKWSPSQYVYKQWAGLYAKGRQQLYVNRGLGFLGYPGRVGILPEISSLVLRKA